MSTTINPASRLWNLLRDERSDIFSIYFFAMMGGLVQLSIPVGVQSIIGFVLAGTLSASLVVLVTVIVAGVFFTGIMQINQMKVIESIQQKIFLKYAYAFADRIPKLDLKKIDGFYLPELVNRFFDTGNLQKSISKLLLDLPVATIQIIFGLALLSFYHSLFIVFGIILLLLLWLILRFTGARGLASSLEESRYKYALAGWLEEMARLIRSFKFSYSSGLHIRKANDRTINYLQARSTHFDVLLVQYRALLFFKVAITSAMLVTGVYLLLQQQINIGQFVAAEIVIITVITAVEKVIINLDSVYDVLTAMEKLGKLTDKPLEVSGTLRLESRQAVSVRAENLAFSYDGAKPVITNVNFEILAGQKICIVGRDGSGKSTLINLLTGVFTEFEGALLIDNIPISNYDIVSLRDKTGILFPQENIFQGTLWENISMGRSDVDRDVIRRLVEITGLQQFISSLPQGYDTELDPTGKRLPRNVVQKILVVRALASRPPLLVMDEPWQGLEEGYQRGIQDFLLELEDTTVIVACNDDDFSRRCDQVIHLKK
jgi:ABC-type bacteriocin/lantibiotic exporter with double-glycine peptidase domain